MEPDEDVREGGPLSDVSVGGSWRSEDLPPLVCGAVAVVLAVGVRGFATSAEDSVGGSFRRETVRELGGLLAGRGSDSIGVVDGSFRGDALGRRLVYGALLVG